MGETQSHRGDVTLSSIGKSRSLSAGLPPSTTMSRIEPTPACRQVELMAVVDVARPPLTMMSASSSNRLTSFSPATTARRPGPDAR